MTRAHALRQLLAHGPLTQPEIVDITGWPIKAAYKTVAYLSSWGHIHRIDGKWTV